MRGQRQSIDATSPIGGQRSESVRRASSIIDVNVLRERYLTEVRPLVTGSTRDDDLTPGLRCRDGPVPDANYGCSSRSIAPAGISWRICTT